MQEQYRREIDNIHAPKDLIERTRQQMEAEVKQTKKSLRSRFGSERQLQPASV